MTTKKLQELNNFFKNQLLYVQALTHRSWINENPGVRESNERLEFLGDAVLEFVVSSHLFLELPDKEEGFLTALRSNIVNTQNLALLATRLNIGEKIYMSRGEKRGGGSSNASLLADTIEALIGAIYIDQGYDEAARFIHSFLLDDLKEKLQAPLKDPKSLLQEKVQSNGLPTPKYRVVEEKGPDHNKEFIVEVLVDNKPFAQGPGKSKNQAEQAAATSALEKLSKLN